MTELAASLDAAIAGTSLEEVTFSLPWMARAFAVTVSASHSAQFTLTEFQGVLIETIKSHESSGIPIVSEEDYYTCWLNALTELLQQKALLAEGQLHDAETRVHERLAALHHDHSHSGKARSTAPIHTEEGLCN